jgi:hypothetical protein
MDTLMSDPFNSGIVVGLGCALAVHLGLWAVGAIARAVRMRSRRIGWLEHDFELMRDRMQRIENSSRRRPRRNAVRRKAVKSERYRPF